MAEQHYYVDIDEKGCTHCGRGENYVVLGPDDVAFGTTFEDRDDAEELAGMLTDAYTAGLVQGRTEKADA